MSRKHWAHGIGWKGPPAACARSYCWPAAVLTTQARLSALHKCSTSLSSSRLHKARLLVCFLQNSYFCVLHVPEYICVYRVCVCMHTHAHIQTKLSPDPQAHFPLSYLMVSVLSSCFQRSQEEANSSSFESQPQKNSFLFCLWDPAGCSLQTGLDGDQLRVDSGGMHCITLGVAQFSPSSLGTEAKPHEEGLGMGRWSAGKCLLCEREARVPIL